MDETTQGSQSPGLAAGVRDRESRECRLLQPAAEKGMGLRKRAVPEQVWGGVVCRPAHRADADGGLANNRAGLRCGVFRGAPRTGRQSPLSMSLQSIAERTS
jgi:hypothetical protein